MDVEAVEQEIREGKTVTPYIPNATWIAGKVTIVRGPPHPVYPQVGSHYEVYQDIGKGLEFLSLLDGGGGPYTFEVADYSLVVTKKNGEMWRLMDGLAPKSQGREWSRVDRGRSTEVVQSGASEPEPKPAGFLARVFR